VFKPRNLFLRQLPLHCLSLRFLIFKLFLQQSYNYEIQPLKKLAHQWDIWLVCISTSYDGGILVLFYNFEKKKLFH